MKTTFFTALFTLNAVLAAAEPAAAGLPEVEQTEEDEEAAAKGSAAETEADGDALRARVRELLSGAEANTTTSSDNLERVVSEVLPFPDRSELLGFLRDLRGHLDGFLRAEPGADASVAFDAPPVRIILRADPDLSSPDAPAWVEASLRLPPPGAAVPATVTVSVSNPTNGLSPHILAARVLGGLLDARLAAAAHDAATNGTPRAFPRWFATGLARLFDDTLRQADYDAVQMAWTKGTVPPLAVLFVPGAPWPSADPALASQLVAYWSSFPARGERFGRLVRRLADGEPWSVRLFSETASGLSDPVEADRDWDAWLRARARTVLTPGVTTRRHVVRTLAGLRLLPGRDGVPDDLGVGPQPLTRLFESGNAAWAPAAAARARDFVLRQAAGRGDDFRAAAADLAEVLSEFAARHRPPSHAAERVSAALRALADSASEAESGLVPEPGF